MVGAAVVVLGALATGTALFGTKSIPGEASPAMSPDEAYIRQVIYDFALAGYNVDQEGVMAALCPDEAQAYADNTNIDPDSIPEPVDQIDITEVFSPALTA